MIATHIEALKASIRTLVLIGALAYALDALGGAIRNHVSPRVIYAGKFRSCRCLLCNYGDLPHLPENGDQQA